MVSAAAHGSSSSITRVRTPMNSPHRNLPRMMELPLRYTFAFSLGEARAQGKLDAGTLLPLRPGTRDDSQGLLHGGQVECVWMLL